MLIKQIGQCKFCHSINIMKGKPPMDFEICSGCGKSEVMKVYKTFVAPESWENDDNQT